MVDLKQSIQWTGFLQRFEKKIPRVFPECILFTFTVINPYETTAKQNLNPKFVLNQTLLLLSVLKLNATKMQIYWKYV